MVPRGVGPPPRISDSALRPAWPPDHASEPLKVAEPATPEAASAQPTNVASPCCFSEPLECWPRCLPALDPGRRYFSSRSGRKPAHMPVTTAQRPLTHGAAAACALVETMLLAAPGGPRAPLLSKCRPEFSPYSRTELRIDPARLFGSPRQLVPGRFCSRPSEPNVQPDGIFPSAHTRTRTGWPVFPGLRSERARTSDGPGSTSSIHPDAPRIAAPVIRRPRHGRRVPNSFVVQMQ